MARSIVLTSITRPEPVLLFDTPNSSSLTFEAKTAGNLLVTFSTTVNGPNGGSPFEWLLWLDAGPSPTMPTPATVSVTSGGLPVSSTQVIPLQPGNHLIQVVVRSPGSVPLTLMHSHLATLWLPAPPP
jgi:hypothetical protein